MDQREPIFFRDPMEKSGASKPAVLLLEDGSLFPGKGFGAETNIVGEVVFTTGMVGYPESMTDPSFAGQLLCFTYPLIGNYGVPGFDDRDTWGLPRSFESDSIKTSGLIVQEECQKPSHWASRESLSEWMSDEGIPGISGVDTRALVTRLRESGVMMGVLANGPELSTKPELLQMLQNSSRYDSIDFVKRVSPKEEQVFGSSGQKIVLVDCGAKLGIVRNLLARGYSVVKVPFDASYSSVMKHDPVGVVISNGPGDPRLCVDTVRTTSRLIDSEVPTLGICLGEQLLGIAAGAETYKLKYGHRGQNKPVVDVIEGRGYVTSQNHGYSIDERTLANTELKKWFINADDRSIEGVVHQTKPCIAVQFHPEASPGPYDTEFVFDRFASLVDGTESKEATATTAGERVRNMRS
jgi:carbamoyl-phosphate synthase small subunit